MKLIQCSAVSFLIFCWSQQSLASLYDLLDNEGNFSGAHTLYMNFPTIKECEDMQVGSKRDIATAVVKTVVSKNLPGGRFRHISSFAHTITDVADQQIDRLEEYKYSYLSTEKFEAAIGRINGSYPLSITMKLNFSVAPKVDFPSFDTVLHKMAASGSKLKHSHSQSVLHHLGEAVVVGKDNFLASSSIFNSTSKLDKYRAFHERVEKRFDSLAKIRTVLENYAHENYKQLIKMKKKSEIINKLNFSFARNSIATFNEIASILDEINKQVLRDSKSFKKFMTAYYPSSNFSFNLAMSRNQFFSHERSVGVSFYIEDYKKAHELLKVLSASDFIFASSVEWRTKKTMKRDHEEWPTTLPTLHYSFHVEFPSETPRKESIRIIKELLKQAEFAKNEVTLHDYLMTLFPGQSSVCSMEKNTGMCGGDKKIIAYNIKGKQKVFDRERLPIDVQKIQQDREHVAQLLHNAEPHAGLLPKSLWEETTSIISLDGQKDLN